LRKKSEVNMAWRANERKSIRKAGPLSKPHKDGPSSHLGALSPVSGHVELDAFEGDAGVVAFLRVPFAVPRRLAVRVHAAPVVHLKLTTRAPPQPKKGGLRVRIAQPAVDSQVKLILSPKQRAKPAASRTRTCTNAAVYIASGECPSRF
jgi:hypothetical protein